MSTAIAHKHVPISKQKHAQRADDELLKSDLSLKEYLRQKIPRKKSEVADMIRWTYSI